MFMSCKIQLLYTYLNEKLHHLLAFSINCTGQSSPWLVKGLFTKTTTALGTREPIRQLRARN